MKKIFTLLLGLCLVVMVSAQTNSTGTVAKATGKPVIDGVIDALWSTTAQMNIIRPFQSEVATVGPVGTTYFKALWDNDGMYIVVKVNDDAWFPAWAPGGGANSYEYDNIELYFDTNYILADGKGGTPTATTGHRQIAPTSQDAATLGTLSTRVYGSGTVQYAYKVTNNASYVSEWFVPWYSLTDKDGFFFDKTGLMGFDITVIDRDPGDTSRKRVNWSNAGAVNENYNNMDDAGRLTFQDATPLVTVDVITIAPGQKITTDNGTLTIKSTVTPADATYPLLKWSIVAGGTGRAKIDAAGVLTAVMNGTIIVKAAATDGGFAESDPVAITISGQKITLDDVNLIQNGDFNQTDPAAGSVVGYRYWTTQDATKRTVNDGWLVCKCVKGTNTTIYANMFGQTNLKPVDATTPYTVKFKAFASTPIVVPMLLEDRSNSNANKETSVSPWRDNGYGKWDVPIGTEPAWYKFDVIFSNWKANSTFELNWQVGLLDATLYVDSVYLYSDADYKLNAKQLSKVNSMSVYPNPVGNAGELTVNLAEAKGSVAIYNSIGQKMMEKVATSTTVKFNVASLRKGMYIVKLSDGTTQKFVR